MKDATKPHSPSHTGALPAILTPLALPHQSVVAHAAGCGPLDVAACVDGAEYSFYAGVAGFAWMVDRTLLQLAYQLDQLRWWMVNLAFAGMYQQLTRLVSPLYVP